MRVGVLGLAMLAVLTAMHAAGQIPHPPMHLPGDHGRPQGPRPALPPEPKAPTVSVFDATDMGSPKSLNTTWRVGISADPAAAQPDFDDSAWAVRQAQEGIAEVADPEDDDDHGNHDHHHDTFAWFRLHIKLAPNHGPVALLIQLPVSQVSAPGMWNNSSGPDVDVFANGRRIVPDGPHGDSPNKYQSISRIYELNVPPAETALTLSIRTLHIPFGMAAYTRFFATRALRLGSLEDLNSALELWSTHGLFERLPRLINSILLIVLGIFLLALYFTQKGHIEYLWLALHELVQAPIGFVDLAGSGAHLDQLWFTALYSELVLVSAYLYFEFLIAFLSLRRRWYIRWLRYTAPIMGLVGPSLIFVGHNHFIAIVLVAAGLFGVFWFMAWLLFCVITLLSATVKRNFEAGLLLIPLVLTFVGILEPAFTSGMTNWTGHEYSSPLTMQAGPVPIHFAAIADFAGLLAIVVIIFVRFLRIHRDQERASSELAAARSVQELMIPHEKLRTPGFEVDSVYNPANEVGGDFFHVETTSDGGLLVVIGDVAGKGLKAAMNVSMLMGALRRTADRNPAQILESLNRVLVGSESFTTCQAAWFGANGELVLANAGHLPPYLNSQEIMLPGGLPLGVIEDVTYEEVRLFLHPGDRLLLMSDGVVEARHSSGELFGFDRVHNLSSQSAFYIADAAREFGQEDDITVLTVRRLTHAVAA